MCVIIINFIIINANGIYLFFPKTYSDVYMYYKYIVCMAVKIKGNKNYELSVMERAGIIYEIYTSS